MVKLEICEPQLGVFVWPHIGSQFGFTRIPHSQVLDDFHGLFHTASSNKNFSHGIIELDDGKIFTGNPYIWW